MAAVDAPFHIWLRRHGVDDPHCANIVPLTAVLRTGTTGALAAFGIFFLMTLHNDDPDMLKRRHVQAMVFGVFFFFVFFFFLQTVPGLIGPFIHSGPPLEHRTAPPKCKDKNSPPSLTNASCKASADHHCRFVVGAALVGVVMLLWVLALDLCVCCCFPLPPLIFARADPIRDPHWRRCVAVGLHDRAQKELRRRGLLGRG